MKYEDKLQFCWWNNYDIVQNLFDRFIILSKCFVSKRNCNFTVGIIMILLKRCLVNGMPFCISIWSKRWIEMWVCKPSFKENNWDHNYSTDSSKLSEFFLQQINFWHIMSFICNRKLTCSRNWRAESNRISMVKNQVEMEETLLWDVWLRLRRSRLGLKIRSSPKAILLNVLLFSEESSKERTVIEVEIHLPQTLCSNTTVIRILQVHIYLFSFYSCSEMWRWQVSKCSIF